MKAQELQKHIYSVEFEHRFKITSTFLRFQEHYESPNQKFKDSPFTLEEYMNWEFETTGAFDYYTAWSGFNVPFDIVERVYNTFPMLTECEKELYETLVSLGAKSGDYVVAYVEDLAEDTLEHEVAHDKFYIDSGYKEQVLGILEDIPTTLKDTIYEWLGDTGYSEELFDDELQAYIVNGITCINTISKSDVLYLEDIREKINGIQTVLV